MKILDDLNTLISYPSRSEDGECCKEALGCVLGLAKSFGLETKCGRHGDVGIVELGEGEKTVKISAPIPEIWRIAFPNLFL